jgi:hypothetical protein
MADAKKPRQPRKKTTAPLPPTKSAPDGRHFEVEERAESQRLFLEAFSASGIVLFGCRAAGVTRQTADYWAAHDEQFGAAYASAKLEANDRIRGEIYRRAVQGVKEPVYVRGEKVGEIDKYSDVLLIFLAKSRMPEFRERVDFLVYIRRQAEIEGVDPDAAVIEAERVLGAGGGA